jgi:PPOX class probable F420-dependent enzyme
VVPDAWHRLARARVARLATAGPAGETHLVPVCFALDERFLYSAVDDKPKRTARLQRLADVAARPYATVLVDHYEEDWSALWWVQAGGPARVVQPEADPATHGRAGALLRAKYAQYLTHRLDGAVLAVELERWRSWSARRT